MVEIRQRRDVFDIGVVTLDDHRQPEAQLAEPHRYGIPVHAEDGLREQGAPALVRRALITGPSQERIEPLEGAHQKRP